MKASRKKNRELPDHLKVNHIEYDNNYKTGQQKRREKRKASNKQK